MILVQDVYTALISLPILPKNMSQTYLQSLTRFHDPVQQQFRVLVHLITLTRHPRVPQPLRHMAL